MLPQPPDKEGVHQQLKRILAQKAFRESAAPAKLLCFTVRRRSPVAAPALRNTRLVRMCSGAGPGLIPSSTR